MSQLPSTPISSETKAFFRQPEIVRQVLENVITKRPKSWRSTSNAPYYNEYYALEVKKAVDGMLEDKMDRMFMYKNFGSLKPSTVYLRIQQGLMYLCEKLDPMDKYKKFKEITECSVERGMGVRLQYKKDYIPESDGSFSAIAVTPRHRISEWKEELNKWLDTANVGEQLHIDRLCLTPEQIKDVKISLDVDGLLSSVTSQEIKVIRTAV